MYLGAIENHFHFTHLKATNFLCGDVNRLFITCPVLYLKCISYFTCGQFTEKSVSKKCIPACPLLFCIPVHCSVFLTVKFFSPLYTNPGGRLKQ